MNPDRAEKINSYSSVHFLSNSEFYAYLYKFGTKHEYTDSLYYSNGGKNGRLRYFRNCKNKDFIRFVAALSLGMLFFACASVVFLGLLSL